MTGQRVLVIRPQPGADQTAAKLISVGFHPVVLPLTRIVALGQIKPDFPPDLIVATSPQAFRHLSKPLADAYDDVRVLVTGRATAQAARDAGFRNVQASGGDVAALIQQLSSEKVSGITVLYLAGRVRRSDLETALAKDGIQHHVFEVYDTLPVSYSTDYLTQIANEGRLAFVLLTSVESVGQLVAHRDTSAIGQAIENAQFICLSSRIAEAAKSHFTNACTVAAEPTELALFGLLQTTLSGLN